MDALASARARLGPRVGFKAVKSEQQVDYPKRRIEGYGSIANVVDLGGDVVLPDAFSSTIAERGPKGNRLIKGFLNHEDLIGMPIELREDDRGLFYVIQVFPKEFGPITDQALVGVAEGGYAHSSFAYDVEDELSPEQAERSGLALKDAEPAEVGGPIRYLSRLKLFELGPVIWPMNEAAKVIAAKREFDEARLAASLEPAKPALVASLLKIEREVRRLAAAAKSRQYRPRGRSMAGATASIAVPSPRNERRTTEGARR